MEQFAREAEILVRLRHTNLPRVTDHFVEPDGAQYLVMDFIEGENLEVLRGVDGLSEADMLGWFDQVLDAVEYLHRRGVIHRDIKPANLIRPADDNMRASAEIVLVDFGIAKVYEPSINTSTNAKAASPGFAAPEQYSGGTDARTDIYALGATLYALLTGTVPPDARYFMNRSARLTPPRELNPGLSVHIDQVILRAMALDPTARFQTAAEIRDAIRHATLLQTIPAEVQLPTFLAPESIRRPLLPTFRALQSNWLKSAVIIAIILIAFLACFQGLAKSYCTLTIA